VSNCKTAKEIWKTSRTWIGTWDSRPTWRQEKKKNFLEDRYIWLSSFCYLIHDHLRQDINYEKRTCSLKTC
jgi:hypothetical protein